MAAPSNPPKPQNRMTPYLRTMLAKVRPGWLRIINGPVMKPLLHKAIRGLDNYLTTHGVTDAHLERYGLDMFMVPATANVFAAFHHFDPQNLVGIILGQDPYPGLGSSDPNGIDACGMSFSVAEGRKIPSSLSNVYKALVHAGILAEAPKTGNLVNWAKRGMLMINTYLTRSTKFVVVAEATGADVRITGNGSSDDACLHKFWGEFTEGLIQYLTYAIFLTRLNHEKHYIGIMLWGAFAQKVGSVAHAANKNGKEVEVMKHGHPSGMSKVNSDPSDPKAFVNCPHFAHFLTKVPDFNWDPSVAPTDRPSRMAQFFSLLKERKAAGITDPIDVAELVEQDMAYNDATTEPNNLRVKEIIDGKKLATAATAKPAALGTASKIAKPIAKPAPKPVASPKTSKPVPKAAKAYLIIATDGGCTGNGNRRAMASYAAYVPETFATYTNVLASTYTTSGLVPKAELQIDMPTLELKETDTPVQPSNNRGELLGMIHALISILRYYRVDPNPQLRMILVVDSEYVIHFVNERMWKYMLAVGHTKADWREKVKANKDLITIVSHLLLALCDLRGCDTNNITACWNNLMQPAAHDYYKTAAEMDVEWPGLTLLYQPSHKPGPRSTSELDKSKWAANKHADELTGSHL